ncbi:hypothetical protein [Rhizobium sp. RCAM05973]|uniref:hypothetical protein n=1 Tax=Rhizobium sp. RCAM05973 TaxID=2994066 RepID=UPI0022EC15A2|nr:hypothetical protein [Rhizobium sp. RCAM05973]
MSLPNMRALAALLALTLLSACGHPSGVMTPVALTAATPKTSQSLKRAYHRNHFSAINLLDSQRSLSAIRSR